MSYSKQTTRVRLHRCLQSTVWTDLESHCEVSLSKFFVPSSSKRVLWYRVGVLIDAESRALVESKAPPEDLFKSKGIHREE
jgi:hypothetical protein